MTRSGRGGRQYWHCRDRHDRPRDGGANWTKILNISEHTGISDVAMDPHNPDVLIATAHQRRRHTWTLIHGGPESGIHKSTDGGATWRRIRTGLPNGDLGRIVPAFSSAQKGLIYAKVETAETKTSGRTTSSSRC